MNEDSHLEADYEDRTIFDDTSDFDDDLMCDSFYDEDDYDDRDDYDHEYDDYLDSILERQELEDFEQSDEYFGPSAEDVI